MCQSQKGEVSPATDPPNTDEHVASATGEVSEGINNTQFAGPNTHARSQKSLSVEDDYVDMQQVPSGEEENTQPSDKKSPFKSIGNLGKKLWSQRTK